MSHQTDCHLEPARLHIAKNEPDKAREHLGQAKALIERTGYHRLERFSLRGSSDRSRAALVGT